MFPFLYLFDTMSTWSTLSLSDDTGWFVSCSCRDGFDSDLHASVVHSCSMECRRALLWMRAYVRGRAHVDSAKCAHATCTPARGSLVVVGPSGFWARHRQGASPPASRVHAPRAALAKPTATQRESHYRSLACSCRLAEQAISR
jgi:hypothetical protein